MRAIDPTAPEERGFRLSTRRWTVEQVAAVQAIATVAADPTASMQEMSAAGDVAAVATSDAGPPTREVSGRYRGVAGTTELELRIDVDGKYPMRRVSGDVFTTSGATTRYFGSFVVNSPTMTVTPNLVALEGAGNFSWQAGFPRLRVTIPRTFVSAAPSSATAQFLTPDGAPGEQYACSFESSFFRTLQYEQDVVEGVSALVDYDTSLLPSGGPGRILSVVRAFAEAGVEMQVREATNLVATPGGDGRWSNAELVSAMQENFSLWRDEPQWKVWLLAAAMHEQGSSLRGIMFDAEDARQRQGCAVFHSAMGGDAADDRRRKLRTYVHELGHCFNLLHSWQKSMATPPVPDRLNALSFMNYPQNFVPGGDPAYWSAFPFAFDDAELVHLRHGFRDGVIMGGARFGTGAADVDPRTFDDPIYENSGLELRLEARSAFAFGEPVVVDIRLALTDLRGRRVHAHLHPNHGFVQLAIRVPSGKLTVYEPLVAHCMEDDLVTLTPDRPAVYESAFIGYGKGGFCFEQPGVYELRAVYHAPDGSDVLSNVMRLRVRSPHTSDAESLAELYFGEEQGKLFYLLGSDSLELRNGNAAFDEVIERFGAHPLSVYAHLVKGVNAGRSFKRVRSRTTGELAADLTAHRAHDGPGLYVPSRKTIDVRVPDADVSVNSLAVAAGRGKDDTRLDNITLNMAMSRLAAQQTGAGDAAAARDTLEALVDTLRRRGLKAQVMATVEGQTSALRNQLGI